MIKNTLLTLIILVCTILAKGNNTNYYVDATNGNDSNNGTSPATAWKTISKVNDFSFSPGDSILFKRGEMWRGGIQPNSSGSPSSPITYAAYEEGEKPLFLGSVSLNDADDWTPLGSNLWNTSGIFPTDVGFILLGNEHVDNVAIKRFKHEEVDEDKEYWYDDDKQRVVLFCTQNPAITYPSIEAARGTSMFSHFFQGTGDYIHFVGLALKHWNTVAIAIVGNTGWEIRNCNMTYGGGSRFQSVYSDFYSTTRYGCGVMVWLEAFDLVVDSCKFGYIYDDSLPPQSTGSNTANIRNMYYTNNIIYRDGMASMSHLFHDISENNTIKNVHYKNNVCIGTGYSWSEDGRRDANLFGFGLMLRVTLNSDVYVTDNVFYEPSAHCLAHFSPHDPVEMDRNYYYQESGNMISVSDFDIGLWQKYDRGYGLDSLDIKNYKKSSRFYTMSEFSDYQKETGFDANSVTGNMLAVKEAARSKVSGRDLRLLNELFAQIDAEVDKVPAAFKLLYPEDGENVSNGKLILEWEDSSDPLGIAYYEVWIDESHVANVTTSQYTTTAFSDGEHSWYVIAVNGKGRWTLASNTSTFTTPCGLKSDY